MNTWNCNYAQKPAPDEDEPPVESPEPQDPPAEVPPLTQPVPDIPPAPMAAHAPAH